jgi:hypothetical protein
VIVTRIRRLLWLNIVAASAVAVGACEAASDARRDPKTMSLRTLGSNPEQFSIGDVIVLRGFLIRPPSSVTFICDQISSARPPAATGACIEMEAPNISTFASVQRMKQTTWSTKQVELQCEVSGFRPGDPNAAYQPDFKPERLAVTCQPDSVE